MTFKHIFAGALAAMLAMPLAAQHKQPVVTINGTKVNHALTRISFSGNNVVLHFDDGTDTETEDVDMVLIDMASTTAIDHLKTFATSKLLDDKLVLGGIAAGQRIAIYDAAGRLAMQTTASGNDMELSLAGLKPGIYIVKAGHNIIKFRKK